jgi:hypothetical protein
MPPDLHVLHLKALHLLPRAYIPQLPLKACRESGIPMSEAQSEDTCPAPTMQKSPVSALKCRKILHSKFHNIFIYILNYVLLLSTLENGKEPCLSCDFCIALHIPNTSRSKVGAPLLFEKL